jgi:hypothetical protein
MAPQERRHHFIQPPGRRHVERPERNPAMPERRAVGDAAGRIFERPQRAIGVLGERMARLRRHDAAPDAGEQIDAEGLLELAHLLGDRRLGDAQHLGRGGERSTRLDTDALAANVERQQLLHRAAAEVV